MKKLLTFILLILPAIALSQIDTVNNGSSPGAGDGEILYSAFQKVNKSIDTINKYNDDFPEIQTNKSNITINTGNISSNTTDIGTNAGNISTNTGNISTNTSDIADNTTELNDTIILKDAVEAETFSSIRSENYIYTTSTIADNDATPDVSGANVFTYNGTANSVVVTDLDNPTVGVVYRIWFYSGNQLRSAL